jgi:hypothetical protein
MPRIALLLSLPLLLAACSGSMKGSIDGERLGDARSALFYAEDVGFGGFSVTSVQVLLTGIPDACEALTAAADVDHTDCDSACSGLAAVATDHLDRDEYWNLSVNTSTSQELVEVHGHTDSLSGEEGCNGIARRIDVTSFADATTCGGHCEDGLVTVSATAHYSSAGEVEITGYTDGDSIQGDFQFGFGEGDSVEGSFSATYCEALGLEPPF